MTRLITFASLGPTTTTTSRCKDQIRVESFQNLTLFTISATGWFESEAKKEKKKEVQFKELIPDSVTSRPGGSWVGFMGDNVRFVIFRLGRDELSFYLFLPGPEYTLGSVLVALVGGKGLLSIIFPGQVVREELRYELRGSTSGELGTRIRVVVVVVDAGRWLCHNSSGKGLLTELECGVHLFFRNSVFKIVNSSCKITPIV